LSRLLRHWATARVFAGAVSVAPRLSVRTLDAVGRLVARGGPYCPVVSHNVAENMRAVGLFSPASHREYFRQLGQHFAGALHALRCADQGLAAGPSRELAGIIADRIELDESIEYLRATAGTGRGAIIMAPHICGYLLNLARLNQEIPLTVYLRHSRDPLRHSVKRGWYHASGVNWICEPADAGGPLGRLGLMAAAISAGRTLFITPDLPRKPEAGTPVRLLGREVYLPAGPVLLAARTRAPLFMLTARRRGQRQQLVIEGPYRLDATARGRERRRAAIQRGLQWFADRFERFLIEQTPMWYLWGDKRWTRVLHGDPRYGHVLEPPAADPSGSPTGVAGAV